MNNLIIVQDDGSVIVPSEEKVKSLIQNKDDYEQLDLDGLLILHTRKAETPALAAKISQMMTEAGLDMETMLQDLRLERERYVKEHYGPEFVDS